MRGLKRIASYFLCFLVYNTIGLLLLDLLALIFGFQRKTRAWLIAAASSEIWRICGEWQP